MDACAEYGSLWEVPWKQDLREDCRKVVERRMKKAGQSRLWERSDLYRLAGCCEQFNYTNRKLRWYNFTDWYYGYQHPEQVEYTGVVVYGISEKPLMTPEQTAHELREAYIKLLVEREIAKRLRKYRLSQE